MAGAWKLFHRAKHRLGIGTINLSVGPFYMHFTTTLSAGHISGADFMASISAAEVASGADYAQAGLSLSVPTWVSSAAGTRKFDTNDPEVVTASSATISGIKFAVIAQRTSAGQARAAQALLCYSTLTATAFDLNTSNTLAVTLAAGGVFTLA